MIVTLLGIIQKLGIFMSFALILLSVVLSLVRLQSPRWLALKKLSQAAIAGLISGLVVAFIASFLLNFMLTYVGSHLKHDGYASCLAATGNNTCIGSPWDTLSFDIYILGAAIGAGVGIARHVLRLRAARVPSPSVRSTPQPLPPTTRPRVNPKAHISRISRDH